MSGSRRLGSYNYLRRTPHILELPWATQQPKICNFHFTLSSHKNILHPLKQLTVWTVLLSAGTQGCSMSIKETYALNLRGSIFKGTLAFQTVMTKFLRKAKKPFDQKPKNMLDAAESPASVSWNALQVEATLSNPGVLRCFI